jgi:hypothetical protein
MHGHYRIFITVKSTPTMIFGIFVIFVLYYIGKTFYELAKLYQKSAWGFAILGVSSYYIGVILGGILVALYVELFTSSTIDDMPDVALNLLAIPFGIASCWGTYRFLKKFWSKAPEAAQYEEVLDGNLRQVESQP